MDFLKILEITRKEAGQFIERYFKSYPECKEYMEDIVQTAKQKGYVITLTAIEEDIFLK